MKATEKNRFLIGTLLLGALMSPVAAYAADASKASKTLLAETDYPPGYKTTVLRTEIPANAQAPLHQHAGIESGYILEGGGTLTIQGMAAKEMKPGMTTIVSPNTPHWFKNGPHKTVIVSTYVVEKDKPMMEVLKP
ncbi:cupin domain-containing protein [Pseudomonas sp. NPDC089752]|uniref:cupin domain-containing protein n=1 Tax=Pseudomonas sp. NPDC089752 TaxID=3364472 RepID=UPI0037F1B6DF